MNRNVTMSLLITVVLLDIVQVITTDHNGALHLVRDNNTSEDASTDGNVSGEGALLVDVGSSDSLLRGLEAQADVLVPACAFALGDDTLVVLEDGFLLLEGTVSLEER